MDVDHVSAPGALVEPGSVLVLGEHIVAMSPATLLTKLNELGRDNGIGRVDLVENRYVGMKSRGVYETPGGAILHFAHRQIESLTMDREVMFMRDGLIPKYAQLVYNGFWYSPEMKALQQFIDGTQENVTGTARLRAPFELRLPERPFSKPITAAANTARFSVRLNASDESSP